MATEGRKKLNNIHSLLENQTRKENLYLCNNIREIIYDLFLSNQKLRKQGGSWGGGEHICIEGPQITGLGIYRLAQISHRW